LFGNITRSFTNFERSCSDFHDNISSSGLQLVGGGSSVDYALHSAEGSDKAYVEDAHASVHTKWPEFSRKWYTIIQLLARNSN